MKVKIEVIEDDDAEQRVVMAEDEDFTYNDMDIGRAYPTKKDTDPVVAGTKLRALKDARSSLAAATRGVEKEIAAEVKRLKQEHARRAKARARKARR